MQQVQIWQRSSREGERVWDFISKVGWYESGHSQKTHCFDQIHFVLIFEYTNCAYKGEESLLCLAG